MRTNPRLIAIGASAGGVQAVQKIFSELGPMLTIPIAVVQHIPPSSRIEVAKVYVPPPGYLVVEVEDKMSICERAAYFAAPDYHLCVENDFTFSLSQDAAVRFSRPSIDVFFSSVAESLRKNAIGILLSGANQDGAQGMKRLSMRGAMTLVQDPNEAEHDVMPKSALEVMTPTKVLPLQGIADFLNQIGRS